jgi:ABC-type phosphate transport system substrate-binding protein
MLVGAVAIAYHLPGLAAPLRLDRDVRRQIFDGRVTRWNAPPIAALNAGSPLPPTPITWFGFDPARLGREKGQNVVAFARWALREGVDAARRLEYVPLPPPVVAHYDTVLTSLSFGPCTAGGSGGER